MNTLFGCKLLVVEYDVPSEGYIPDESELRYVFLGQSACLIDLVVVHDNNKVLVLAIAKNSCSSGYIVRMVRRAWLKVSACEEINNEINIIYEGDKALDRVLVKY